MRLDFDPVNAYVDAVLSEIRYKPAHGEIKTELLNHIQEKLTDLGEPVSPESVEKCIDQMGDPKETGKQFNKTHRPPMDWRMLGLCAALFLCGLLYSAHVVSGLPYRDEGEQFTQSILFALLGVAAVTALCLKIDLGKLLQRYAYFVWIACALFFLWPLLYNDGPLYSELTPLVILLSALCIIAILHRPLLEKRNPHYWLTRLLPLVCMGISFFFILQIPSFAAAAAYLCCVLVGAYSKANRRAMLVAGGIALAFVLLVMLIQPHRLYRYFAYYNSEDYPRILSSQLRTVLPTLRLVGQSSAQALLPENLISSLFTLYPIAGFFHSFGILPGAGLCGAWILLLFRLVHWSFLIKDPPSRGLCLGVSVFLSIQMLASLLSNFGLLPDVYIFTPFLEPSWSTMLLSGICIALLLSFGRTNSTENAAALA